MYLIVFKSFAMKFFQLFFVLFLFSNCAESKSDKQVVQISGQTVDPVKEIYQDGYKRAYFASGCFWCVEGIYESVIGVKEAVSGYSGGTTPNPTYKNQGNHAETVEVIYDPNRVTFETLLDVYFASQNITQVNGQGPDRGINYRSIVFYRDANEKAIIDAKIAALNLQLEGSQKVAAHVMPFQKFYRAEEYHQNYAKKNPNQPYIRNVSKPRKENFKNKHPELLKSE